MMVTYKEGFKDLLMVSSSTVPALRHTFYVKKSMIEKR